MRRRDAKGAGTQGVRPASLRPCDFAPYAQIPNDPTTLILPLGASVRAQAFSHGATSDGYTASNRACTWAAVRMCPCFCASSATLNPNSAARIRWAGVP